MALKRAKSGRLQSISPAERALVERMVLSCVSSQTLKSPSINLLIHRLTYGGSMKQ